MNDITNRFLKVYEYLLETKEVTNKTDFTQKIDISSSLFTEISKGRTNVGVAAIQNTVGYWDWINPKFLLNGVGSIDLRDDKKAYTPLDDETKGVVSEVNITYNAPPTKRKNAPPTAPPTHNLGLPKVITILENTNEEVVSLVGVKAAAGYLNGYADPEYVSSLPTMRLPRLTGGTHRAFEAKGHSMNPTIHNNSIVIGRWVESLNEIRDRRIYVVVTKNEGIVIKRVLNRITETGNLILISDNQNKKEYPNIILDADEVTELWYLRGGLLFEFPEPNELHNRFNDLEAQVTIMQSQIQKMLK